MRSYLVRSNAESQSNEPRIRPMTRIVEHTSSPLLPICENLSFRSVAASASLPSFVSFAVHLPASSSVGCSLVPPPHLISPDALHAFAVRSGQSNSVRQQRVAGGRRFCIGAVWHSAPHAHGHLAARCRRDQPGRRGDSERHRRLATAARHRLSGDRAAIANSARLASPSASMCCTSLAKRTRTSPARSWA